MDDTFELLKNYTMNKNIETEDKKTIHQYKEDASCAIPVCSKYKENDFWYNDGQSMMICGYYANICDNCSNEGWISKYGIGGSGICNDKKNLKINEENCEIENQ